MYSCWPPRAPFLNCHATTCRWLCGGFALRFSLELCCELVVAVGVSGLFRFKHRVTTVDTF